MAFTKVVGAGIHTLSNITSHNINSSGIITATKFVGPIEGDITAVDGVFTGNVSIGGTLTYEDVKNVDSVGVGTFREGIFIPDSKRIRFGNTNASPNFSIYSTPTYKQGVIDYTHTGTGRALRIRATNLQIENWNGLTPTAKFIGGVGAGHVELNYAGSKKFETTSSGVSIGGTTIITPASGGKLGIGTNIPLSGTHISDGAAYGSPQNASRKATLTISAGSEASADIQLLSANYNHIFFGDSADPNTGMIHYEHTGSNVDSLVFSTAGSERLRIYSDGDAKFSSKLGVGVEPVEYLDIRTTGSATALVGSTNAGGAYFKLDGDSNGDGSGGDYARLVHDTDGRFYIDNLKSTADIVFRNGASATERLRIVSNGYVNIGTGSAEQQLTVQNSAQHCVIRVISKNTHDVGIDFGDVDNTDIAGVRYSNSENSLRLNANAATRLKIDSGGRTMIGGGSSPTQVGDGRLIVYSTDRLHPSIKPAGTSNNYANGYSMIGDNYTATESQVNLGVSYSSGGLVLSRSVKVSGTTDDTYLSSQAQYATRPCAIKLDSVGAFNFLTTETNANTAVDSAVTLSKRLRIASNGTSHFYGNQTSTPEGDFGFRWDKNSYANFQLTNTNNTTVNAGARITLKTNVGNITGTYYNNGGFYLVNSANGYFNYYSNGVLRVNIDTNGNFTLNPGSAVALSTSNGQVGKRFGIKSTQNNIVIGETTSSGNSGLILESRVTGRSGNARCSQLDLGNGFIKFYTAASGADVTERLRIASGGDLYAGNEDGYAIFDNSTVRPKFQFRQHTGDNRGFAMIETRGDGDSMKLYIAKSRSGNGVGILNAGDQLGSIQFTGADGTNQVTGAEIFAYTQSGKTIAADRMPTNLSFRTHDDNTAGKKERMRIFHDGRISMSKNEWAGSDSTFGLTVHTGSTSETGPVNDGIMIVSQQNNGNQNSSTGKLMFCGHAQTNGPFLYGDSEQAYGKKGLVFHTHSTSNSYSTQLEETARFTHSGRFGLGTGTAVDSLMHIQGNSDTSEEACQLTIEDEDDTSGSQVPSIQFKGNGANTVRVRGTDTNGLQFATWNGSSHITRMIVGKDSEGGGALLYADDRGWATFRHNHGQGLRTHIRQRYAPGNSVTTHTIMRVRRNNWGWGTFKFTIKSLYYYGTNESVWVLNGHGVNGDYYHIHKVNYGGNYNSNDWAAASLSETASSSSPGTSAVWMTDVKINIPNYTYAIIVVEAYSSQYSLDPNNMNDNSYCMM